VLEAVEHMGTAGLLGHKDIVLSTVGEPRAFERLLRCRVKPALALSLHSTDPERRARLLPRAPRVHPRELLERACDYARRVGHPLQLQWTLIAGVNDGDDELERLVEWLPRRWAMVNFIPYNPQPGASLSPPSRDRVHAMTRALHRHGVVAKRREPVGLEVEAACGQLRARATAPVTGTRR
jgi:23S rRNA (adenine2503-C2)-methyltransferase